MGELVVVLDRLNSENKSKPSVLCPSKELGTSGCNPRTIVKELRPQAGGG